MCIEITKTTFNADDVARYEARLRRSLKALAILLEGDGFGAGAATIGAELELDLIDGAGRPCRENQAVLIAAADPRVTLEVDRFNLEINADPVPLAGAPFTATAAGLSDALKRVSDGAATVSARVIAIGILPTITADDLRSDVLTAGKRYRALSAQILKSKGSTLPLHIEGHDTLDVAVDDVTAEGANTSFQLHLKVQPARFANAYNAAQLAVGPVLSVCANAPLFLGHRLWDETRIAHFRQAVDDRPAAGVVAADDWRPSRVSFGLALSVARRRSSLPSRSITTRRSCPCVAMKIPSTSSRREASRVWRNSASNTAPSGAGTAPSTTTPTAGTCASSCARCRRGRASPT